MMIVLTLFFVAVVEVAFESLGEEHAYDQAAEPDKLDLEGEDGEEHDGWSGAEASDSPAQSEAEGAEEELEVNCLVGGVEEVVSQDGLLSEWGREYFMRSM
jgi:cbb3-type cytochrome oxidase subunit 3